MKQHGEEEIACWQGGEMALRLLLSHLISVLAVGELINCLSEKGQAFIFESHLASVSSFSLKRRERTDCSSPLNFTEQEIDRVTAHDLFYPIAFQKGCTNYCPPRVREAPSPCRHSIQDLPCFSDARWGPVNTCVT